MQQGDLFWSYVFQLRSEQDELGPGPDAPVHGKLPFLGRSNDIELKLDGVGLTLRAWGPGWVILLTSTCELDHLHKTDCRLIVAPVVFREIWAGTHWDKIRDGRKPGYVYLPPMPDELKAKIGADGWLAKVEATAVLASTTLISRKIAGKPRISLTSEMRHVLQERLVSFFSVRDWKSADEKQLALVRNKRIADFSETDEPLPDGGKLFKVALANGEDDEMSVGMVFRLPPKQ